MGDLYTGSYNARVTRRARGVYLAGVVLDDEVLADAFPTAAEAKAWCAKQINAGPVTWAADGEGRWTSDRDALA